MAESLPLVSMTGRSFADILAKEVRLEHGLAGVHPVDVAPQRVDLTVVSHVPVGWARSQLGNVLVLNREWIRAKAVSMAGLAKSG